MSRTVIRPPYVERVTFADQGVLVPSMIALHSTEGGTPHSVVNTLRAGGLGIHWIIGQNGGLLRGNDSTRHVYHVAAYNHLCVGIEQCGFAAWSHAQWMQHPSELLAAAWIIAWEAQRHGIPLVQVHPINPTDPARGITRHMDLGSEGGGHHDPGPGYPISHVLGMARSITLRNPSLIERGSIAWASRHLA